MLITLTSTQSRHNGERNALFAAKDPNYKVRTAKRAKLGYPSQQPFQPFSSPRKGKGKGKKG